MAAQLQLFEAHEAPLAASAQPRRLPRRPADDRHEELPVVSSGFYSRRLLGWVDSSSKFLENDPITRAWHARLLQNGLSTARFSSGAIGVLSPCQAAYAQALKLGARYTEGLVYGPELQKPELAVWVESGDRAVNFSHRNASDLFHVGISFGCGLIRHLLTEESLDPPFLFSSHPLVLHSIGVRAI